MWLVLGVSCGLQLLAGLCTGVTVTQNKFAAIRNGANVSLPCEHDGDANYDTIFWYRQDGAAGKELGLVARHIDGSEPEIEVKFKGKYHLQPKTRTKASLCIISGTAEVSAVYFCATSGGEDTQQYFGDGTKLTVLEDGLNITEPEVAIFAPSQKEIKEKKKATLVCVATGFYPDHIKVTWIVNGGERTEGVGTDEHATRENQTKMYSLTSRLRIPSQEWFNPKNNFQCLVSFYGKDSTPKIYPKAIQGVAGCSVTEELYQRSSRTGYFVYLMLFCKSILYGLFVMGLILRSKKMH